MSIKNNEELIFKLPANLFLEFTSHFENFKNKNWPPKIVKRIDKLIRKRKNNGN